MENNKYYTPTIEEFHVGFEYEHNFIQGEWNKCVISEPVIVHKLDLPKIRVKYLDKEDIESLGWEKHWNGIKNFYVLSKTKNANIRNDLELREDNVVVIWRFDQFYLKGLTIFIGKIKNKSELKKLMQQLEII